MKIDTTIQPTHQDNRNTKIDYLVLGQGLCGTLLSWYLLRAGKRILVVDVKKSNTASRVASGVINPVTGRRIVRTWRIEELLPFAWDAYKAFGKDLGTDIISQCNILDFFAGLQMKEAFDNRLPDEAEYLKKPGDTDAWKNLFNYHFGLGEINPCLLVDINSMLKRWRIFLIHNQLLLEETFDWSNCTLTEEKVVYNHIESSKIICCEGVAGFENPYFKNLPYSRMKGEALIASIPGLPRQNIYKQGINIVPWQKDLFWVGSTYEWDFKDVHPTIAWRKKVEAHLNYLLKVPFEIVDHLASERPANMERRPFVGLHPAHPSVGILNGMGAKGCSLAPFFANQLANHLVEGDPIYVDADVKRFEKVLARIML